MVQLLASVNGIDEAQIALRGNADIIDLKNPADGALGALPPEVVRETVAFVAGRRPVSAVCGNLPMNTVQILAAAETYAETGVDYLKIGLFPEPDVAECIRAVEKLATNVRIIAVLFADRQPDFDLLPKLAESHFHGVMLDTAEKGNGGLLRQLPADRVARFVEQASALQLKVGLAGSLEAPDIPRLLALKPDFLGFRRALCVGGRRNKIDEEALLQIRKLIPEAEQINKVAKANYRSPARSAASADAELGTDKIFVREFILPMEIGAYDYERGHTQKVRFDVTADVLRITDNPQGMQHVVSYDVIMDGIRMIVASGHIDLVETLAEKVASFVLENPRVVRVTVRVEKLEIAPARVGVEIERVRDEGRRR